MPGHTGAHGGDKPGPSRGRRGGDRRGVGGMTPGPGPGGQMIGGAAPPGPGQAAAQGGTTAGFAGQPTGGGQGGGGQSLQDLFAAQQPPAQGITTIPNLPTIPTDQELMQMINQTPFGPPTEPNTPFSELMDTPFGMYGFPDYSGFINPLDEDNQSAYDSNMSYFDAVKMNPTFSNIENFFDTATNPELQTGLGTFGFDPLNPSNVDLDTSFGKFQFDIDDNPSFNLTMPLGK
jgi:hypothetical protein